ncbi:hypothetical protein Leryth_015434 [Lithospermum erythrorhizon]|nr:hypothetical protein Leryth_015434 [Lithospermum erythrorhizon]
MGKTGKWFKHFLSGKKDKTEKDRIISNPTLEIISPSTPKEKRRWSFRRSSATPPGNKQASEPDADGKKHALAVATATTAAANAAVAAAKAAAAVIQLTTAAASGRGAAAYEEAAATKIQSHFRGYLARKALNALKGLVKLQALVRGHLVRKQAAATLKCMQALIAVQARTRAQRLQIVEESKSYNQKQFNHRRSSHEFRRNAYQDSERGMEENIKIVEMDHGDLKVNTRSRNSYSNNHGQLDRLERRISTHRASSKHDHHHQQISPSPSALTDQSPRACSNHFEEYSFGTVQSSPQYTAISRPDTARIPVGYARSEYHAESIYSEYQFYPSYMANTKSSRAKVRSHSAPKQRPESYERPQSAPKQRPDSVEMQPSRRRPSLDGRNVPRGVRMQRSSSQVGPASQNYQYPWSVKLDKSSVSLKDSECGSTSTVVTSNNYSRSVFGYEVSNNLNRCKIQQ